MISLLWRPRAFHWHIYRRLFILFGYTYLLTGRFDTCAVSTPTHQPGIWLSAGRPASCSRSSTRKYVCKYVFGRRGQETGKRSGRSGCVTPRSVGKRTPDSEQGRSEPLSEPSSAPPNDVRRAGYATLQLALTGYGERGDFETCLRPCVNWGKAERHGAPSPLLLSPPCLSLQEVFCRDAEPEAD